MFKKVVNVLFYVIAAFYVIMMMELLFRLSLLPYMLHADRTISRSHNLTPFKTIREFTGENDLSVSYVVNNILGNIAVFVPYGIYLGVIKKRKELMKCLLTVAITSTAVEIIQFASGLGAGDIDDVLLNSLGGLIGILGYKLLRNILKEEFRTKTAVTVISLVVGTPVILSFLTMLFRFLRL